MYPVKNILDLEIPDDFLSIGTQCIKKFIIEYIWVQDFKTSKLYSQTNIVKLSDNIKTLDNSIIHLIPLVKIPNQYVNLKPIYIIKNPFTSENTYIALCEMYGGDISNNRLNCELTLTKNYPGDYFFNTEQEFIIEDPLLKKIKLDQKFLYVGDFFSKHREFTNSFVNSCVKIGLPITSMFNQQLNKWVYGMGDLNGTEAGDVIWITRYLLLRISESYEFAIKFGDLKLKINDIDNLDKFSSDPYMTISVMISTIHKVKTDIEIKSIKQKNISNTMDEQLIMKESIRIESEKIQQKLTESYKLEILEHRERNELEKWNVIKEHEQHIEKLRREAQQSEQNKLKRNEQIQAQLRKRQEQEELERILIIKEKEKQSIIQEEKEIIDAELTRLQLLREEMDLKRNKEILNSEIEHKLIERQQITKEINEREKELQEEEFQIEQRKKEELEQKELNNISSMLDNEFQQNESEKQNMNKYEKDERQVKKNKTKLIKQQELEELKLILAKRDEIDSKKNQEIINSKIEYTNEEKRKIKSNQEIQKDKVHMERKRKEELERKELEKLSNMLDEDFEYIHKLKDKYIV